MQTSGKQDRLDRYIDTLKTLKNVFHPTMTTDVKKKLDTKERLLKLIKRQAKVICTLT
jgi:hypothetical protein